MSVMEKVPPSLSWDGDFPDKTMPGKYPIKRMYDIAALGTTNFQGEQKPVPAKSV